MGGLGKRSEEVFGRWGPPPSEPGCRGNEGFRAWEDRARNVLMTFREIPASNSAWENMLLVEMNHLQVKSCRRENTPEHSQTATQQSDFMHCGQAHVQMCAHVSRGWCVSTLTANAGMSAPGKPGWWHRVNKPFAETGSGPGRCRTHRNGECLLPACAPDPEEIYRQQARRDSEKEMWHWRC